MVVDANGREAWADRLAALARDTRPGGPQAQAAATALQAEAIAAHAGADYVASRDLYALLLAFVPHAFPDDAQSEAAVRSDLGATLLEIGPLDVAYEHVKEANRLLASMAAPPARMRVRLLTVLSAAAFATDHVAEALEAADAAEQIAIELGAEDERWPAATARAQALLRLGAVSRGEAALDILKTVTPKDPVQALNLMRGLRSAAQSMSARGRYREALGFLDRADALLEGWSFSLVERQGAVLDRASLAQRIANHEVGSAYFADARRLYERALEMSAPSPSPSPYFGCAERVGLAILALDEGDGVRARTMAQEALARLSPLGAQHANVLDTERLLIGVEFLEGANAAASARAERLLAGVLDETPPNPSRTINFRNLAAEAARRCGDRATAAAHSVAAIADDVRSVSAAADGGWSPYDSGLARRGAEAVSALADALGERLYGEAAAQEMFVGCLLQANGAGQRALRTPRTWTPPGACVAQVARLYTSAHVLIGIERIARRKPEGARVRWIEPRLLAWALGGGRELRIVDLGPADVLVENAQVLAAAMARGASANWRALKAFTDPLNDLAGDATSVDLLIANELASFPFAAVPDRRGRAWCERASLAFVDPLALPASPGSVPAAAASSDAVIVSAPLLGAGEGDRYPPLENVVAESAIIAAALSGEVWEVRGGEDAKAQMGARIETATIVHVAAHGDALSWRARSENDGARRATRPDAARLGWIGAQDDDYQRAFIVLDVAQDWLVGRAALEDWDRIAWTAADIARLDLARAPLVFLNLCNGALGASAGLEGPASLARAFVTAGARAVIATLWTVGDQFARDFATDFYAELKSAPSARSAFHGAQRRWRARASPQDWACHVLYDHSA